jgi:transglutaminase-like putative cysteine protease
MKSLIYIVCLALFVPANTFAYKLSVDSIPFELRENASAVIRSDQMVFTIESAGKAKVSYRRVITLMNENAEYLRLYQIYYDNFRSVQNIHASVYDANGKFIESIPASRIMDVSEGGGFVSDARVKRIIFPVNRYPFTIEVEYDVSISGLLNLPQWNFQLNPALSVEESAVQYVIPRSIPFRYSEYNMHGSVDSVTVEDKNIYTWVERGILAIKKWYFSPLSFAQRPVLLAAIDDFEFGGIKGSMRSWKNLGEWAGELNQGLDQLSVAEKKRISDLLAGLSDDKEKARMLYSYMQSRTRYASIQLGIGGYKPAPAFQVSEKGYGDCKGLANYMAALLKEAGITSYYTLVKSGVNRSIIPSFVSDQFDHIILCVPFQKDTVWLECTNQTIPFNYLGTFTSDRNVLLVTPEGGKLVRTPSFRNSLTTTTGVIEIKRREASTATLSVTSGGSAFDDNQGYAGKSETEIRRILNNELPFSTFSVASATYTELREDEPLSTLSYTVSLNDFAVTTGTRIHFMPCFQPFEFQPFDTVAVKVYDMPTERDSIIYRLPVGYEPEFIPQHTMMNTPYGSYRSEIKILDDGSLLYTREFRITRGVYTGPDGVNLFAFLNKAAEKDHQRLFLVRKQI